jgi:hypothetical protein
MAVMVLFFAAISPVFRNDLLAKGAGIAGTVLLSLLAAAWLFRSGPADH